MSFLPGWFPSTPSFPSPRMRFVNTYDMAFGGAANKTITVPAIDLVFPASPTKQILVLVPAEAPTISGVTINGVLAPLIVTSSTFCEMYTAVYSGVGPFNIVVTLTATSTEDGAIHVYEIDEAAPVYQGARNCRSIASATAMALPLRVPSGGLSIAACMAIVDTVTSTWTGITEVNDQDTGDYSMSSAANLVPVAVNTSVAVLDTLSAASSAHGISLAITPNKIQLQGGFRSDTGTTASGTTATFTAISNYTGLGNFRLILLLSYQADNTITGVTFNGNACTLIGQAINTVPVDVCVYAWYIDVTQAAPSGNIVATFASTATGVPVTLGRVLAYNVGSIGDVQTGISAVAAGAALQVDVNVGGMIVGAHIHDTTTDTISWSGLDGGAEEIAPIQRTAYATRCYCDAEINRAIQATASGIAANATIAFALNP